MEMECWEASFQSNQFDGSTSESSTSRILCDLSNPIMMRWQADKNGSQTSLFGGSTQTTATSGVQPRNDSTLIRYTVKIINAENKGGYITQEFQEKKFSSIESLQSKLVELFGKYADEAEFELGYLTPGKGFKGKQFLLTCDNDVLKMYEEHAGRRSINLWMKVKAKHRKRPSESSDTSSASQTKRARACESHLEKMDELQKIVDKLKEKHKEGQYSHFSSAQFHCWGNTIQLGHHDSFDQPPNKPFFGVTKKATASAPGAVSPGKRIHLRSECIDQLTKWHKLMNDGVITLEEYQDMHKTILGDIKKF